MEQAFDNEQSKLAEQTPSTRELVDMAGINAHLIVESAEGFGPRLDLPIAKERARQAMAEWREALLDQAENPSEADALLDLVEALVQQECVSDWFEANGRDFGHNFIPVYEQACKALAEARPERWKLESWGVSRRTT